VAKGAVKGENSNKSSYKSYSSYKKKAIKEDKGKI